MSFSVCPPTDISSGVTVSALRLPAQFRHDLRKARFARKAAEVHALGQPRAKPQIRRVPVRRMPVAHDEQRHAKRLPHVAVIGGKRVEIGGVGQQRRCDGQALRGAFSVLKLAAGRNEQRRNRNLRRAFRFRLGDRFRRVGHDAPPTRLRRPDAFGCERAAQLPIRVGGLHGPLNAADIGGKRILRRAVGNGNQNFLAHADVSFQKRAGRWRSDRQKWIRLSSGRN